MKLIFFDTSSEVTNRDINHEPEMIELKRMIREGDLDAARTIATIKEGDHETETETNHEATVR
jgi:hypothetical protein